VRGSQGILKSKIPMFFNKIYSYTKAGGGQGEGLLLLQFSITTKKVGIELTKIKNKLKTHPFCFTLTLAIE
jgi:hypothetical protein